MSEKRNVSRRTFLKTGGLLGLATAAGAAGANVACAQSRTIKIGRASCRERV